MKTNHIVIAVIVATTLGLLVWILWPQLQKVLPFRFTNPNYSLLTGELTEKAKAEIEAHPSTRSGKGHF